MESPKETKIYNKQSRKVFVAMSGGVDSSVSAALLKKDGYKVTGVFIHGWEPDFIDCTRVDDRREAMRAAAHLGIQFLTFNFEEEYKKEVVDYMVREYKTGRTPNPDVVCNQKIKFGFFLKKAIEKGADYIATGHYARTRKIKNPKHGLIRNCRENLKSQTIKLLAGVDKNKDQSYFLWTLTQKQLAYILFPIGKYTKPKVREMARKFELPNAEKKDSQGLCFVGKFKMIDFLKHYITPKNGDVLNIKREVIGSHDGAAFFTLGQRHGFTVSKKIPNDTPYYVIAKDIKKNTITVSHKDERKKKAVKEVIIENVNFISGEIFDSKKIYQVRFRYRQLLQKAKYLHVRTGKRAKDKMLFHQPQNAVTPGQSVVLYDGDECMGGGVISRT